MRNLWLVAVLTMAACGMNEEDSTSQIEKLVAPPIITCDWPQAFGTADHAGKPCPEQRGMAVVAKLVQDTDVTAIVGDFGFQQIHEGSPITSGDWLVLPTHTGYTSPFDRSTDSWGVSAYRWVPSVAAPGAQLVHAWDYSTKWQPTDSIIQSLGSYTNGYVPLLGPSIANGSVYVPQRNGRLARLNLKTGAVMTIIDPLVGTVFDGDERAIVVNATSIDRKGRILYAVTAFPTTNSRSATPRASWLVRVNVDDTFALVDWTTLASAAVGVPGTFMPPCEYAFGVGGTPPATGPDSRPPLFGCGAQRPGFNAPVATKADGTLVAYSYANNAQGAAFLLEIDGEALTPIAAHDTRGLWHHGCGVRLDDMFTGGSGTSCDTITAGLTTNIGNDPDFNGAVRLRGNDLMDNAPVVGPDGGMTIGGYDGGFFFGGGYDARGMLATFTNGLGGIPKVAVNTDYGWEVSPSAWVHGKVFSYLEDRNRSSDIDLSVAQYSPLMVVQKLHSIPFDFNTFPTWQDAHIPFGMGGDLYAVSGDGHLYKFLPENADPTEAVILDDGAGNPLVMPALSSYIARDVTGRLYVSYAGFIYVVASSGAATTAARTMHVAGLPKDFAKLPAMGAAAHPLPSPPSR